MYDRPPEHADAQLISRIVVDEHANIVSMHVGDLETERPLQMSEAYAHHAQPSRQPFGPAPALTPA